MQQDSNHQNISIKMDQILQQITQSLNSHELFHPSFYQMQCLTQEENNKLINNVLCRVSSYFIELTELCLPKLNFQQAAFIHNQIRQSKHAIKQLSLHNQYFPEVQIRKTNTVVTVKPIQEKLRDEFKNIELLSKMRMKKPKHPVSSFFFFFKEKSREASIATGEVIGSKIAKIVSDTWNGMTDLQKEPYEKMARQTRYKYEQQMSKFRVENADQIAELKKYKQQQKKIKKETSDYKKSKEKQNNSALNIITSKPIKIDQQLQPSSSMEGLKKQMNIKNKKQEVIDVSESQSEADILSDSLGSDLNVDISMSSSQISGEQNSTTVVNQKIQKKPKAPISSFFIFVKEKKKQLSEQNGMILGPKMIKVASQIWNKLPDCEKGPYKQKSLENRVQYYKQMRKFKQQNAEQLKTAKKIKKEMKKQKTQPPL